MFDDIIGTGRKNLGIDKKKYENNPFCPYCGSKDIKQTTNGSVFKGSKRFDSVEKCNFCGKEWIVVYDENLSILDIKE